jgi:hypothetical protein
MVIIYIKTILNSRNIIFYIFKKTDYNFKKNILNAPNYLFFLYIYPTIGIIISLISFNFIINQKNLFNLLINKNIILVILLIYSITLIIYIIDTLIVFITRLIIIKFKINNKK